MNYEVLGELKTTMVGQLKKGSVALRQLKLEQEGLRIEAAASDLDAGIFKLMVAGEFSRGKSTLVNALLKRNLLIMDVLASTAVITVLRYSRDERVEIHYKDGSPVARMTFKKFKDEFSLSDEDREVLELGKSTAIRSQVDDVKKAQLQERIARFDNVERADFFVDYPMLGQGVNLIDSPGLAESDSRTLRTEDYARKSHAFVLVLSATNLLTQTEVKFLTRLKQSNLGKHLFVAVNFAGALRSKDRERVDAELRRRLAPLFTVNDSFNEARFRSRVFLLDLKPLVDAWDDGKDLESVPESTSLPALERAIEAYLCSPEPMEAAFATPLNQLDACVTSAEESVVQRIQLLEQPLETSKKQVEDAERTVKSLNVEIDRLVTQYRLAGDQIANVVFNNLVEFVQQMPDKWGGETGYMKTRLDLSDLGLIGAAKAMFSDKEKERLASIIEREGRLYVERSLEEWADELPSSAEFQQQLTLIDNLLGGVTRDLLVKIAELKGSVGAPGVTSTGEELQSRKIEKTVQAIAGLIVGPSLMAGALAGDGKWSGFIGKAVTRLAIGTLLAMLTPAGWFAFILVALEAVFVGFFKSGLREKFGEKLGSEIHAKLGPSLIERRLDLIEPIQGYFKGFGDELAKDLRENLDQQVQIWKSLLEEVDQRKGTLDTVRTDLQTRLNELQLTLKTCREAVSSISVAESAKA